MKYLNKTFSVYLGSSKEWDRIFKPTLKDRFNNFINDIIIILRKYLS